MKNLIKSLPVDLVNSVDSGIKDYENSFLKDEIIDIAFLSNYVDTSIDKCVSMCNEYISDRNHLSFFKDKLYYIQNYQQVVGSIFGYNTIMTELYCAEFKHQIIDNSLFKLNTEDLFLKFEEYYC